MPVEKIEQLGRATYQLQSLDCLQGLCLPHLQGMAAQKDDRFQIE